MSDTPRTDAYVAMLISEGADADSLEHFARELERELNAANERVVELEQANRSNRVVMAGLAGVVDAWKDYAKQLEQDGDEMAWALGDGNYFVQCWRKAKEAKP